MIEWPLYGVNVIDVEFYIARIIEHIAKNAQIYTLLKLDPTKQAIPIFFWDATQEKGILDGNRKGLAFPCFNIQRNSDIQLDALKQGLRGDWQNTGPIEDEDLVTYWGIDGTCFLSPEQQAYLKNASGLSYYAGSDIENVTISVSLYHTSPLQAHYIYNIMRTFFISQIGAPQFAHDGVQFLTIQCQPQASYATDAGLNIYEHRFTITTQCSFNYIVIRPAHFTTDVIIDLFPTTETIKETV